MNGTISRGLADRRFTGQRRGRAGIFHAPAVRDGSVFEQLRDNQPVTFDVAREKRVRGQKTPDSPDRAHEGGWGQVSRVGHLGNSLRDFVISRCLGRSS
jgi:hypothetical protein